jgi:uroporphyrinogen decarboxylase
MTGKNSRGRERFMSLAAGVTPDRPPVSFWRHFYTEENEPQALAEALLGFHREFGWDWIKLNPRASYHLEDWGYRFEPSTDPLIKPVPKYHPVATSADWARIEPLDPTEGVLGEHLQAIRRVALGAGGDPVLMTVFTPLSIAGDLVADDQVLLKHLRESPEMVTPALEAITATFERFAAEVLNAGADGLFFATTQWGSHALLTDDEYVRWGRPYDLRVLAAASGADANLLHVCDRRNMLPELSDYPVQLFNWGFEDEGNWTLEQGSERLPHAVVGGVGRKSDLLTGDADDVRAKIYSLGERLAGKPWGCGPDCSIYPHSRTDNLRAVRAAIDELVS